MPTARPALLLLALLATGLSFSRPRALADELPADTNLIQSLTPEQARKLALEFPGVKVGIELKGAGSPRDPDCLPLNGLKSLDAETARALAGYGKGPLLLNGLTALDIDTAKALADFEGRTCLSGLTMPDAETAKTLVAAVKWDGWLPSLTALDSPDSVEIAKALAARKGQLSLPNLKKISSKTLTALIEKEDVEIPLIETLELIPEPDGSPTEDFVIPERFRNR